MKEVDGGENGFVSSVYLDSEDIFASFFVDLEEEIASCLLQRDPRRNFFNNILYLSNN